MAVGKRQFGEVERTGAFEVIEQYRGAFEYILIFRDPILHRILGRDHGAIREHGPAQRALLRVEILDDSGDGAVLPMIAGEQRRGHDPEAGH